MFGISWDWFTAEWTSVALAAAAAGGGVVAAIGRWRGRRKKAAQWPVGFSNTRHRTVSNIEDKVEWLMIETSISNVSDAPVSVIEYGMSVIEDDKTFWRSVPVHYGIMENGHPVVEDPVTHVRTAIDGHFDFLHTPLNLAPGEARQGWLAFHFHDPVPREIVAWKPLIVALIDGRQTSWTFVTVLGEATPGPRDLLDLQIARR